MNMLKAPPILPVKRCFYLKFQRCVNTCNGDGYAIWSLAWAWFKKRGRIKLWTQILGNGDCGARCQG